MPALAKVMFCIAQNVSKRAPQNQKTKQSVLETCIEFPDKKGPLTVRVNFPLSGKRHPLTTEERGGQLAPGSEST